LYNVAYHLSHNSSLPLSTLAYGLFGSHNSRFLLNGFLLSLSLELPRIHLAHGSGQVQLTRLLRRRLHEGKFLRFKKLGNIIEVALVGRKKALVHTRVVKHVWFFNLQLALITNELVNFREVDVELILGRTEFLFTKELPFLFGHPICHERGVLARPAQ